MQQVVGWFQQMAGGAVMPWPQALAIEKAAVGSVQQALGIADQAQELIRADQYLAYDDVVVEQLAAAQQMVRVDAPRAGQVDQRSGQVVGRDEAAVAVISLDVH